MNKPEVSIIMSVYKESENAIRVAVSSILDQTLTNWELILVNDNPENTGTDIILSSISSTDERIRVITNDRNRALGYSLNAAVRESRSDVLARMDTEDISTPARLEKQLTYMHENPHIDLLFTQWYELDESGKRTLRAVYRDDVQNIKKSFFIKSVILHPTMMVRKQVLVDHPYSEFGRPEDLPLFLELIRLDYSFDILEEPLYTYMIDRSDITLRYKKIRVYSKNMIPVLVREIRWYWANLYFWMYFVRMLMEFLVSRNRFIFRFSHRVLGASWKRMFKSA